MFYSISQQLDPRFPNCKNMNSWWICTDPGWSEIVNDTGHYWLKGYSDTHSLEELARDWALVASGNYTIIRCGSNVDIKYNIPRSYPLAYTGSAVTNLIDSEPKEKIYSTQLLQITADWQLNKSACELRFSEVNTSIPVAQTIAEVLTSTSIKFLKTNVPQIKLFRSNGLDTTLVQALLDYLNYPYELVQGEHYASDWFTKHNRNAIEDDTYSESGWGYRQIHHYTDPTWLATGAWGDEYFLRGPDAISKICSWHGINLLDQLTPGDYHYTYFNKKPHVFVNEFNNQTQLKLAHPDQQSLNRFIIDTWLSNDFQHWHLGNTLTWTPLKQLAIANILIDLPIDQLVPQFTHGQITRDVIKLLNPNLLNTIADQKNA